MLIEADLSQAKLIGSDLTAADLTGANLHSMFHEDVDLFDAQVYGAILPNGTKYEPMTELDLLEIR